MNAAVAELVNIVHQEPDNFGSVWGIEALNGLLLPTLPSLPVT
jgi:hypothetical protein